MRGVAAMMVVIFHILVNTFGSRVGELDHHIFIFSGGVDLFFVISGFVMFHSTIGRNVSTGAFIQARIIRLVPLYWLSLLVMLVYGSISRDYIPPFREIAYSFIFIPYQNEFGVRGPVFNPGWTLNYEMFFYSIFALTLFLRNYVLRALLIMTVFAGLILLKPVLAPLGATGAEFANGLITEFLMGMCVGIAYHRGYIRFPKFMIFVGIAIAITLMESTGFKGPRMLYAGVPAAFILAGLIKLEPKLFKISLLGLIGDASYSLYLSHTFVIDLVELISPLKEKPWNGGLAVLAFIACIAAGIAVYYVIEKPLLQKLKKFSVKKPAQLGLNPA
jgi:exopolysaccharide production protein ExoZ